MSVGGSALRSESAFTTRVLIAAKAPLPGRAKTRLSPPLTPQLAARLAGAFLCDVLAAARAVDPDAGFLCLAADAGELRTRFAGVRLVVQSGQGLSDALSLGVKDAAVVVAGDAAGIGPEAIVAAAKAKADVVLAPSHDGGFGLIRMQRYRPAVFEGIRWSTGSVLQQIVAASRTAGLTVELLDRVADVDTVDDLAGLDLSRAHATRAVLSDPAVIWPAGLPSR